jgi:hypothetical protein
MDTESVGFYRAVTFIFSDLLRGTTLDPSSFYSSTRLLNLYAADRAVEGALPGRPAAAALPLASAAAWAVRFAAACYGAPGRAYLALASQGLSLHALGHTVQSRGAAFAELAGVPQGCLVGSFGGRPGFPRSFLVLDKGARAVVVAIRGTMSWSDVVTDCCGQEVPFCGGRSHAGMAHAARSVWSALEAPTLELLAKNPGFSLVLSGHSLGGGTASLLCILLNRDRDVAEVQGRATPLSGVTITAFAFASPPCFAPLELLPPRVQHNMCVWVEVSARCGGGAAAFSPHSPPASHQRRPPPPPSLTLRRAASTGFTAGTPWLASQWPRSASWCAWQSTASRRTRSP